MAYRVVGMLLQFACLATAAMPSAALLSSPACTARWQTEMRAECSAPAASSRARSHGGVVESIIISIDNAIVSAQFHYTISQTSCQLEQNETINETDLHNVQFHHTNPKLNIAFNCGKTIGSFAP